MGKYTLVPMDVPTKVSAKGSIYDDILIEFEGSGLESVWVDIPDSKPNSVVLGLRKRIAASGSTTKVAQRGGKVFIMKA